MAEKKYKPQLLKQILLEMVRIRRFEEKAAQMYGLRKIGGFLHLYIGQEAVGVGAVMAGDLQKDHFVTAYRDHGHAIACGMDMGAIMAELFGKESGCSGGKGGSMHMFSKEKHMYGGNGIVGAHLPVATGIALKLKYKKEDGVALGFFGDGAIHQGAFHESLNLAGIWNLPIVYICENNHYGMGTDYRRVSAIHDYSIMAGSYGINGGQVDGMDVLAVYDAVSEAIAAARKGKPSLLDIKTYRYKGHSASDPGNYRTKEELEEYKKKDPIIILKDYMINNNVISEDDYKKIDKDVKQEVSKAVEFAESSKEPVLDELYTDIYV